MGPAAMARDHVIDGQVSALATTVLAGVAASVEDLAARQLDARPGPADLVLEADHGRRAIFRPRRPGQLVVVLEHFGPLSEYQPESTRQIAHVERLIVLIQNEDHAVHERIVPEHEIGLPFRSGCGPSGGPPATAPRSNWCPISAASCGLPRVVVAFSYWTTELPLLAPMTPLWSFGWRPTVVYRHLSEDLAPIQEPIEADSLARTPMAPNLNHTSWYSARYVAPGAAYRAAYRATPQATSRRRALCAAAGW